MFNIIIPVTKSKRSTTKNVLEVEGIASDPSIDRDNERFSEQAVQKMLDGVVNGGIPIRVEHENKFYSDIGVWKEAKMVDDKLRVKGEVDLDYSFGKDLAVLLEKGGTVALSVGGRVIDATMEYVKEIGKMVKTYTDVILSEISVVKNPSNYNASLSMAKSFDVEKHMETTEAQRISSFHKSLQPLPETKMNKIATERLEAFLKSNDELIEKCCEDVCCPSPMGMTASDIKLVINLSKALKDFGFDKLDKPKELTWEFEDKLPEESFVLDLLPDRVFPHHNEDFTLNKSWLDYQLSRLLSGEYNFREVKTFGFALNHLYHHYKEENMTKAAKEVTKSEEVVVEEKAAGLQEAVVESNIITAEELELMNKCYKYFVTKEGDRPQVSGNDLSDKEVKKVAEAYRVMMERKRNKGSLGMQMAGQFHQPITATKPVGTEGQVAVNKDALSNNDTEMPEVTKNNDGAEDTTTVVEEASNSVSENPAVVETTEVTKTVSEEVVEGEATATEETAVVTEEVVAEEVAKSTEEVTEEVVEENNVEKTAVTPGKKMSDSNAKRQARQELAVKGEEVNILDAVESLAKSLEAPAVEEKVETVVETVVETEVEKTEEVTVEAPATIEATKEETVETEKAKKTDEDEDDAAKNCGVKKSDTEIAVEKLTAFLMDSVIPMIKGVKQTVDNLESSVAKSQEVAKSFSQNSNTEFQKSFDGIRSDVDKLSETVSIIAKSAQPRKSIANTYLPMEKSFGKDNEDLDTTAEIHKAMDAGMSYSEARTSVYKKASQN